MKVKRPLHTGLQFEALEPRWAMAGNVLVDVSGLNIKITGDDAENEIEISIQEIEGLETLVVTGRANSNTTVTGGQVPLPNDDDFKNLTINLGKAETPAGDERGPLGADTVVMTDLSFAGNLSITGKNAGVVVMEGVEIGGTTKITFGKGRAAPNAGSGIGIIDSSLGFPDEGSGKSTTITTADNLGDTTDRILIFDTDFGNDLTIKTNDGKSIVSVFGTRFEGDEEFPFESSTFVDGKLSITGGNNEDCVGLLGVVVEKSLTVSTLKGNDFTGAADLAVVGTTTIKSTDGDDIVAIGLQDAEGNTLPPDAFGNVLVGNVTVDTGKGNDLVAAQGTQFGEENPDTGRIIGGKVTVKLGDGDDRLTEGDNEFLLDPEVAIRGSKGGKGTDSLNSDLDPDQDDFPLLQFENNNNDEEQVLAQIFAEVEECFADPLRLYGIDIGNGGGGDDDDDTIDEAIPLGPANIFPSKVEALTFGTDVDMYTFTASAGQVFVSLSPTSSPNLFLVLRVFDASGEELPESPVVSPDGGSVTLQFNAPVDSTFFVGVSGDPNVDYSPTEGDEDVAGTLGVYTLQVQGN